MRKLSAYFFFACMLAMAVAVTSCSKDGDTGPAGPAGEVGPEGPGGPAGEKGDTGVANVIYSDWLDVTFSLDTAAGSYFVDIDAPKLTADVIATGLVKTYINIGTSADPVVMSLPYNSSTIIIREYLLEGFIELLSNANMSTYTAEDGTKSGQVRYVIIPGGTAARTSKAIDWNDYAQVKAYMGWKN